MDDVRWCDKDVVRDELKKRLKKLIIELERAQNADTCYEVREYVECPPDDIPPPRREPHPYIPGRSLYNYPNKVRYNLRVTVDGRLAQPYTPATYYYQNAPLRVPPWSKPRYPSIEIRAGHNMTGCDCWRKNGLQDDCQRWDCNGRPECKTLSCPPSIHPPILGVRHKNGFETIPLCKDDSPPFGPFPMKDVESFTKYHPPTPPMKQPLPDDVIPCVR